MLAAVAEEGIALQQLAATYDCGNVVRDVQNVTEYSWDRVDMQCTRAKYGLRGCNSKSSCISSCPTILASKSFCSVP